MAISVNSLSGGKTSSYLAVHYPADHEIFSLVCIDDKNCRPKDPSIIKYANEKLEKFSAEHGEFIGTAEDDKTLHVMRDLEQILGREIIWVRGKSFDRVIDEGTQTRLPSWARRYCTEQMKLLPIFTWWYRYIGEKVEMRIGFRSDEFSRMERFFNNSDPVNFPIPIYTRNYGQKKQVYKEFNWRYCSMPLVRDGITHQQIKEYWKENGYINNLFEQKKIDFPVISNCVGCFHKKEETLAVQADLNENKMNWFAEQEKKNMGTWLDSRVTYEEIMAKRKEIAKEFKFEMTVLGETCDSGGCTA